MKLSDSGNVGGLIDVKTSLGREGVCGAQGNPHGCCFRVPDEMIEVSRIEREPETCRR